MDLEKIWAKTEPFQSVRTHGIVTGILAQIIYREVLAPGNRELLGETMQLDEDEMVSLIGYWVSLHDIGKIEFMFQCKDEQTKAYLLQEGYQDGNFLTDSVRHEGTSMEALKRIWRQMGVQRGARNFYAGVIGLHHQGKAGDKVSKQGALWQNLQLEFEEKMRQIFCAGKLLLPDCTKEKKYAVTPLLLGILILADWIASGEDFQDAQDTMAEENGMERIRKRGEQFFADNEFETAESPWAETFCGVWPNIPQDGRRPLQTETEALFHDSNERVRLLLLEAPMGEGKTEAGMYAALQMQRQWGKNGFYVALPTAATSNQMVGRMRKLMQLHGIEDTVRLLHAMAWLVDAHTPETDFNQEDAQEIRSWLSPLRRGMLSPYAVGTVDQAMLAATKVRYGVLRLLGLANKVLVIDEIHSYDVYMDEIILRLLEWCLALDIPVVMLSATLPTDKKEKLLRVYGGTLPESTYPSITAVLESGKAVCRNVPPSGRRLEVALQLAPLLNEPAQIAQLAVKQVEHGGCLCVLMNTVAEAQKVYSAIKQHDSGKILLFHAQFSAERREEIEKECLNLFGKDKFHRPQKAILVATQVVEQSLDVDFDGMITAAAPMDLLLQRLGRVHRHGNTPRPDGFSVAKAWILVPEKNGGFGPSGRVYPECLISQAIELLTDRRCIVLPDDIQPLVQDGYDSSKVPPERMISWFEKLAQEALDAAKSELYLLNHPWKEFFLLGSDMVFADEESDRFLAVKTRLGEPSVRIALVGEACYQRILQSAVQKNGRRVAPIGDLQTAQEVLRNSVSVRESKIKGILSDLLDILGDKLLYGIHILPAKNGVYQDPGGAEIRMDSELGLIITEEGQA